jgi:excisionase family DNA binding protein
LIHFFTGLLGLVNNVTYPSRAIMGDLLTTGEAAELLGTQEWRIRRLFESGDLPEPQKFGGKRVIPRSMIPKIIDAMRLRGWIESEAST